MRHNWFTCNYFRLLLTLKPRAVLSLHGLLRQISLGRSRCVIIQMDAICHGEQPQIYYPPFHLHVSVCFEERDITISFQGNYQTVSLSS